MTTSLTGERAGTWRVAMALAVLSLLFFAVNVDFLMRGDATTYATYVLLGKFDDITLHNGYYFIIYALHHGIAAPLGVPVHETMALVNVLCGAVATALVYLLVERLVGQRAVAIMAAVLYAISGRVLMNATSSEIYMMQTVFVLLAMWWYAGEQAFAAGLAAGASLLVSPLSAFAFLFFPVWELTQPEGVRWRAFGRFVLGGTLVYMPYLVTCWRELFWGRRGLLVIRNVSLINVELLAVNTPKYLFKHYTALLLLLIPATLELRTNRRFFWLTLATVLPHAYIVAKLTSEDHTFLLNADPFLCAWMALGAAALFTHRHLRWLAPLPVVVHLLLFVKSGAIFSGQHHRGYADELRQTARTYLVGKPAVMITDWDVSIAMTHFGRDSVVSIPERDPLFAHMYDLTARDGPRPSLAGQQLYLMETWSPSGLNRLLRSPESLDALRRTLSVRAVAERRLGLRCSELSRRIHVLYRCEKVPSSGGG